MGILFKPDAQLARIDAFDAKRAIENGVSLVFSDLDNTLSRWNDTTLPAWALAFAARLDAHGIDLCLVSNNDARRVEPIARRLNATYIARACKPFPWKIIKYRRAKDRLKNRCILVGDQLLTDVLAGNLAGIQTILVRPIDKSHEYTGTKINRKIEAVLMRILKLT